MSQLDQYKAVKRIEQRNKIEKDTSLAISKLNASVNEAVEFAILLEENPNAIFSDADKDEIRADFAATFATLNEVVVKATLLDNLRTEAITLAEFKTQTSKTAFNATDYLNSISI